MYNWNDIYSERDKGLGGDLMVGDVLRKEREKQGLTIADIEQGTSIRALYLEHIERGNIGELPGMVYAKGFVRNYAGFLHLDAERLVQQFVEEQGGTPAPSPVPEEAERPSRISLSSVGDEALSRISIGGRGRSSYAGIFGKLAVGILVLVAVVGGGAALISYINTPAKETAQAPRVQGEQPAAAPASAADASDEARSTDANPQDVRVDVRLTERCWTEVQVDGKTVFEGILEKGKTDHWQGKDDIVVRVGNAGALEVTANGKRLGKFGDEGAVMERRFTKDTKDLKDTAVGDAAEDERPTKETKQAPPRRSTKDTKNTEDTKSTKRTP